MSGRFRLCAQLGIDLGAGSSLVNLSRRATCAVEAEDLTRGGLALGLKERRCGKRRLPPSARSLEMSAAIVETGSMATTSLLRRPSPWVFAFCTQAQQSIVVDPNSPGSINSPHGLILFDGVCVLCSRGCGFVS